MSILVTTSTLLYCGGGLLGALILGGVAIVITTKFDRKPNRPDQPHE